MTIDGEPASASQVRKTNTSKGQKSGKNIAIFFAIPAVLFVSLDLDHALRVGVALPIVGLVVLGAIRLADFNHFNRQSFEVLQLFKARTGVKATLSLKRSENLYFGSRTGLIRRANLWDTCR